MTFPRGQSPAGEQRLCSHQETHRELLWGQDTVSGPGPRARQGPLPGLSGSHRRALHPRMGTCASRKNAQWPPAGTSVSLGWPGSVPRPTRRPTSLVGMHLGPASRRDRGGLLGSRAAPHREQGKLASVPLAGRGDVGDGLRLSPGVERTFFPFLAKLSLQLSNAFQEKKEDFPTRTGWEVPGRFGICAKPCGPGLLGPRGCCQGFQYREGPFPPPLSGSTHVIQFNLTCPRAAGPGPS